MILVVMGNYEFKISIVGYSFFMRKGLSFFLFVCTFYLQNVAGAQAELLRYSKCKLSVNRLEALKAKRPKFILFNGIPATSLIYEELAQKINTRLGAEVEFVDLPGTGLSRNARYSWSASEACVHAHLKNQKEPFILVVHDIAGPIILPTLADKTLKIEAVLILNTILSPQNFRPIFPLSLIRTPLVGALVSPLIPFFYFEKEMRTKGISRNEEISEEKVRELYKDFSRSFGKFRLHRVMRGFELNAERDQRVRLGLESSLPKLTIWGMSDPSLSGQFSYVSRIKNNEIVKLKEAKHFLMLDYSEEIYTAISNFVRRL